MSRLEKQVSDYIDALRGGSEDAHHRLIELGARVIPLVGTCLQTERDPAVRAMLVNVAWQIRSTTAVPLLANAVDDPEPSVWKEALDGLVTLGGSLALDTARKARDRAGSEKSEWLDEAIQQISERARGDVDGKAE